ncbi:MAG: peptide deformylase [Armatimonadetes bacterium]|nr:peptide deformylase [Armatimonadota bacterium]
MAQRKILLCTDPILRRKAERVRDIADDTLDLLDEMVEMMLEAPGIGLAAPQVGVSQRCIVARDKADTEEQRIYKIINPRVQSRRGEQWAYEGCLSLPTLQAEVRRAQEVVVTGLDENGEKIRVEAEGLLARCLQHEVDHLDGVLFIDRAEAESIGWMVPDESEEDGYRLDSTTIPEVMAAFERMQRRLEERERQQEAERQEASE